MSAEILLKFARLQASGFIERWLTQATAAAHKEGYSLEEILESTDPEVIGRWAQDFWEELPDSESIHTPGFYVLCDIAEWFCEE